MVWEQATQHHLALAEVRDMTRMSPLQLVTLRRLLVLLRMYLVEEHQVGLQILLAAVVVAPVVEVVTQGQIQMSRVQIPIMEE
jgi:hypothetical protein